MGRVEPTSGATQRNPKEDEMSKPLGRLQEAIAENQSLIESLERDLSTCPAWKLSHAWGLDRQRALADLRNRREMLRRVAENN
jgi:hypothetical protein